MVLLVTLTSMNSKVVLKMYVNDVYFCSSVYAKLLSFRKKHIKERIPNFSYEAQALAGHLATVFYTNKVSLMYAGRRNLIVGGSDSSYLNDVLANIFTLAKVKKIKYVNFTLLTFKKVK